MVFPDTASISGKFRAFLLKIKFFELLVFITISSFMWILTSFSRKYTDTIEIPVEFVSNKLGKILVNDLPSRISVRAYATGFELLKHKAGIRIFPIVISLDKYSVRQKADTMRYEVDTKLLFTDFEAALGGSVSVKHIDPVHMSLEYSQTYSKKVAIKPRVRVRFAPQHKLSNRITANPDSVTITGPYAILDTMKSISTVRLNLLNMSEAITRELLLDKPAHVKISETSSEISVNVERFTEHQLQIPLQMKNSSSFEHIELMQTTATVRFIVCLSAFSTVSEQSFVVAAIVPALDTLPSMLEVRLLKKPENISVISVSPAQVDYLIKKE